ncbi:pentapeptide repeat-containing protein [Kushneria phosphatilytica]|uniref:Pentapeptide repeat-containing protein n=1 Tax=Kushneria phosphatilytica TaxID=657387 RepID=A0A1S1NR64_9GAMM|nr:pentapeptide repeat-containing protein [Kushneria phosphatilytica]OHV08397.1 hypothetical protein BH688_13895 [Kushneria phosphatilytica]QEL09821.1 pentapeptide repeat-containing protein [Kushneria phosphatilytica]
MMASNRDYDDIAFEGEKVDDQTLEASRFDNCSFKNCDFSHATFRNCRFTDCSFDNSNLSVTQFPCTLLQGVAFNLCKMMGIDWPRMRCPSIQIPGVLSFEECVLDDSSFFGLYLAETTMISCRIHRVDFSEANCEQIDFSGSDLEDTIFNRTRLRGANFIDATHYSINILENDIKNARFSLPEAVALLDGLDIELHH